MPIHAIPDADERQEEDVALNPEKIVGKAPGLAGLWRAFAAGRRGMDAPRRRCSASAGTCQGLGAVGASTRPPTAG